MQIKTVMHRNPERFDQIVNDLIERGWTLKQRTRYGLMLVADLERTDDDWRQALLTLKRLCELRTTCCGCPVRIWCDAECAPCDLKIPEAESQEVSAWQ